MTDKTLEPRRRQWKAVNVSPLVSKCRQLFWKLVLEKNCNDFSRNRFFWMQTQHTDLTRKQAAACARDTVPRKGDHLSTSQPEQHTSHLVLLPEAPLFERPPLLFVLSRRDSVGRVPFASGTWCGQARTDATTSQSTCPYRTPVVCRASARSLRFSLHSLCKMCAAQGHVADTRKDAFKTQLLLIPLWDLVSRRDSA